MIQKRLIILLAAAAIFSSCSESKRNRRLQAKTDSLEMIVKHDRMLAQSLREMSSLIGSIGVAGRAQRSNESPEATVDKMRAVSMYVSACRHKIDSLERTITATHTITASYSAAIKNLKYDLQARDNELAMMDDIVTLSLNQNENLIHVVGLQRSEIDDKLQRLRVMEGDNARLQTRLNVIEPINFSKSYVALPPLK